MLRRVQAYLKERQAARARFDKLMEDEAKYQVFVVPVTKENEDDGDDRILLQNSIE